MSLNDISLLPFLVGRPLVPGRRSAGKSYSLQSILNRETKLIFNRRHSQQRAAVAKPPSPSTVIATPGNHLLTCFSICIDHFTLDLCLLPDALSLLSDGSKIVMNGNAQRRLVQGNATSNDNVIHLSPKHFTTFFCDDRTASL